MKVQLITFYCCGCISLFASPHHLKRGKPRGFGFRIRTCSQCKIADEIINEILAEERAVQAALVADAAYQLQTQGTLDKKLDIYG